MRLCRYEAGGKTHVGFYFDDSIVPLETAARLANAPVPATDSLLPFLTGGSERANVLVIQKRLGELGKEERAKLEVPAATARLKVPVPSRRSCCCWREIIRNTSKREGGGPRSGRKPSRMSS